MHKQKVGACNTRILCVCVLNDYLILDTLRAWGGGGEGVRGGGGGAGMTLSFLSLCRNDSERSVLIAVP